MAGKHSYFAYGSNLCVRQMAQRCPDASDPRRATLSDHDWLINERGVATVERFAGAEVHGVIWQLSDHDLATLDSAEGVPVRYRRDELTVHTDTGPAAAWGPGLRDRAIWSGSSTARATTACPIAGSSSWSGGIPPAGRSALLRRKMLHHSPFQSSCVILRSSSTACCVRSSASWPSTVAVWSR